MAYTAKIVTSGKMTGSEYRMLHLWVEKQLGKPKLCKSCGSKDESKRYHWSNNSGDYLKTIEDWERLCVPCHKRKDMNGQPGLCKQGHSITGDNAWVHKNKGINCRKCKNQANSDYWYRNHPKEGNTK